MTFAFGHLIGGWFGGKVYEFLSKKKINHFAWLMLLFGAILPDIDLLFDWTITYEIHRTFTHSFLFLIIVPLLVYISLTLMKDKNKQVWTSFLFMGIAIHLFLDTILAPGIPLFWPNLLHISFTSIQYLDPTTMSLLSSPASVLRQGMNLAIFDMGIGVTWIFYLWWKRKIKF